MPDPTPTLTAEQREVLAEALAEVLSWTSGEMTRYDEAAHPDHNRWSWRGDGHGEAMRQQFREQADALAPVVARMVADAEARALREAADAWCAAPPATPDGPIARWLRDRADALAPDAAQAHRNGPSSDATTPARVDGRSEASEGARGAES